jgi:predicted porin
MASVGAGYTMGDLTAKLNYFVATNEDALQNDISKVEVLGLGVDWKTASNNTVSAIVYYGKDKLNASDKTTSLILTDEYALSKRTTLYATVVVADADKNASLLTTIVAGGTRADSNSTLFNVGVRHTF